MSGTSISGTPSESADLHLILAYPGACEELGSGVPELASCLACTGEVVVVEPSLLSLELGAAKSAALGERMSRLMIRGQFGSSPTLFESAAQIGQITTWLARRTDPIWLWLTTPYLLAPFLHLQAIHRIARPTHDWREDLTIPTQHREVALAVARAADLLMPPNRQSDWGSHPWFPLDPEVVASDDATEPVDAPSNTEAFVIYQGPVDYRLDYPGLDRLLNNNPHFRLVLIGARGLLSQDSNVEFGRLLARADVIHLEDVRSQEAESLRCSARAGILPLALEDLDFSEDLAGLADYCRRYQRPGIVTGAESQLAKELNLTFATIEHIDLEAICEPRPTHDRPPRFLERVAAVLCRPRPSQRSIAVLRLDRHQLGEMYALQHEAGLSGILAAAATMEAPTFEPEHRRPLVAGLRALSQAPRGHAWAALMARLGEYYFYSGSQRRGLNLMERLERGCRSGTVGARMHLDLLARHRAMRVGCGDAAGADRLDQEIARIRSTLNISDAN